MRRTAHTLKGSSRSVEFAEVETISAAVEKKLRSLSSESEEPSLSSTALDTLREASEFIEMATQTLLADSSAVLSSEGLMELVARVESLTLVEAPVDVRQALPNAERIRIRLLVKILKTSVSPKSKSVDLKKAHQVMLSLNALAKENQLYNIASLTEAMEDSFRDVSNERVEFVWKNFELGMDLLQKFSKKPVSFQSEQLKDAIEAMRGDVLEDKLSDAFLEETKAHLGSLKDLLNEASEKGRLNAKEFKVCLMALTGATRAVDVPVAETICRALDTTLSHFAESKKLPPELLLRASESVELLDQEIQAYAAGVSGLPTWKILNVVDRLETSVYEFPLDDEKPATPPAAEPEPTAEPEPEPAPVPTAEPVSAAPISQVSDSDRSSVEASPASSRELVAQLLDASAPMEALTQTLSHQVSALGQLGGLIAGWKADLATLDFFSTTLVDEQSKATAKRLLREHSERLDTFQTRLEQELLLSGRPSSLLSSLDQARRSLASVFLESPETLKSCLETEFPNQIKAKVVTEKTWDSRYWSQTHLKDVCRQILDQLRGHVSKQKDSPSCEIGTSEEGLLQLRFFYPGQKVKKGSSLDKELLGAVRSLYGLVLTGSSKEAELTLLLPPFPPARRGVFFASQRQSYCLPTYCVDGVLKLPVKGKATKTVSLQGSEYTIHHLCPDTPGRFAVCFEKRDGSRVAIVVQEILGEQPIVLSDTVQGVAVLLESQEAMILNPDLPLPTIEGRKAEEVVPTTQVIVALKGNAVRNVLGKAIGRAGFEVVVVANGKDALEALRKSRADSQVLLTELRLEDMSGELLCESSREASRRIHNILLTDSPDEPVESSAVSQRLTYGHFGLDELLEKLRIS